MVSPSKKTKAPSFHGKLRIILFVPTVVIVVQVLLQKSHHVEIASELNSNIIKHNGESKEIVDKPTYKPASTEEYIMTHMQELGYHPKNMWGAGCKIWESPEVSNQENFDSLHAFKEDLKTYKKVVEAFNKTATGDILHKIRHGNGEESQSEICKAARPHPDGIQALFPSKQLSFTKNGFVEPLLTPMRNPRFCEDTTKLQLDIDYIIHDFEAMCLQLKPASKIVLIDMGASLAFHSSGKQPAIVLMEQFEKFGLYFDQIFAFEVTPQDPIKVYRELLPQKYISSYHWINAGMTMLSTITKQKINQFTNFQCIFLFWWYNRC